MYVVFFSIQSGRTNHSVNQKQNHDLRDERMKNKNKTINIKVRRRTQQTIIKEQQKTTPFIEDNDNVILVNTFPK